MWYRSLKIDIQKRGEAFLCQYRECHCNLRMLTSFLVTELVMGKNLLGYPKHCGKCRLFLAAYEDTRYMLRLRHRENRATKME